MGNLIELQNATISTSQNVFVSVDGREFCKSSSWSLIIICLDVQYLDTAAMAFNGVVLFVSGPQRHIEDSGEWRLATGYPGATARRGASDWVVDPADRRSLTRHICGAYQRTSQQFTSFSPTNLVIDYQLRIAFSLFFFFSKKKISTISITLSGSIIHTELLGST